jgi:hypothetical protein
VLCDWSSGGRAGLAPIVRSGCALVRELWALGLWQVCVGHALGSPVGQRSVKSLAGLKDLLVLELRQWVEPWSVCFWQSESLHLICCFFSL